MSGGELGGECKMNDKEGVVGGRPDISGDREWWYGLRRAQRETRRADAQPTGKEGKTRRKEREKKGHEWGMDEIKENHNLL